MNKTLWYGSDDRLLDPDNDSVTLKTLQNAAATIGAHLEVKLVFNDKAS